MKTKTHMKIVHSLNQNGIARVKKLRPDHDDFIETIMFLESAMDEETMALIADERGNIHFFGEADFDKVTVQA